MLIKTSLTTATLLRFGVSERLLLIRVEMSWTVFPIDGLSSHSCHLQIRKFSMRIIVIFLSSILTKLVF